MVERVESRMIIYLYVQISKKYCNESYFNNNFERQKKWSNYVTKTILIVLKVTILIKNILHKNSLISSYIMNYSNFSLAFSEIR